MGDHNKLVRGMIYGAAFGAVISLLDRETREKTVNQVKDCSKKVWNYGKNPSELIDNISHKISATRHKIEEVSDDIAFIVEKVNEIKESGDKLLASGNSAEGKDNL